MGSIAADLPIGIGGDRAATANIRLFQNQNIGIGVGLIEMLRAWREKKLTEQQLEEAQKTWEMVKKIIDDNRDRKLFS